MKNLISCLLLLSISINTFAASSGANLGSGGGGIPVSEKGSPNGVATLDPTGKVPVAQLPGGAGVSSVSGTAPVVSSGGATPDISMAASTNAVDGYLTAADHTTFAAKEPAISATTSADYYRGDKTFQNLNAAAIGSLLTGYSAGAGIVAATDSVLQAIQKLDGNISALPAGWKLAGNAGTGGTGVVGTTDAQPWTTVAGGVYVDGYQIDGQVSSILNITALDTVTFSQKRNQTNLTAGAATTTANFYNQNNSVGYGGTGFNYGGSIRNVANNISLNGAEVVSSVSSVTSNSDFSGGGTATTFKGHDLNVGVTGPYTFGNYVGVTSYLNADQFIGGGRAIESGVTFNDSTLTNFSLLGGSISYSGTSTNSGNLNLFDGTLTLRDTSDTSQAYGQNFGVQLMDSATATSAYGQNSYVNVQDSAAVSGQVYGMSNAVTMQGAATTVTLNGENTNIQLQGTSNSGNVTSKNTGLTMSGTAAASSVVGDTNNIQLSGANVVPNIIGRAGSVSVQSTSAVQNLTGDSVTVTLQNAATADNFYGFNYALTVDNTAALTNTFQGGQINMQTNGGATVSAAQGLKVNMNGVNLSPAALAAGAQKTALSLEGGALSAGYDYTVPGASTFFQNHYMGGSVIVAAADPTSAFGFGSNLAQTVTLHDDWNLDASGLGFVDVGFVGALGFDAGKTMARWTGALSGAGNPSGAGTLTDAIMYRAAGILPQGGALSVTNMYGFQVDPNLFGIVGTNKWGFYENGSGIENALSKLAIGTSTQKVANSDTALEIGGQKAFLPGRGTTAQKNAITAIEGMQFYDTDIGEMEFYDGASWVSMAGGAGAVTAVSVVTANGFAGSSSGGATPALTLTTSVNGIVKGNGTALSAATANTDYQDVISTSTAVTNQFVTGFTAPNTFTRAQPAFSDISGVATNAQTTATSANTINAIVARDGSGDFSAGTITAALTGNASTSTALAANPTDCGAGTKATTIDAQGNLTCSAVSLTADVSGVIPTANGGAGTANQETPSGTIDNSNVTFTLSQTPVSSASVNLKQDGLALVQGTDYTITGTTITMTTAPNFGQTLYADYRY